MLPAGMAGVTHTWLAFPVLVVVCAFQGLWALSSGGGGPFCEPCCHEAPSWLPTWPQFPVFWGSRAEMGAQGRPHPAQPGCTAAVSSWVYVLY